MPSRSRPAETARSEHWLRVAVNDHASTLNRLVIEALEWDTGETIEWLSPVRANDFAEYYDQSFLDRLRAPQLKVPLSEFWPAGGPRWDGLARTESGKLLLVEAKAHIDEMVDFRSGASGESLALIKQSLSAAKAESGASAEAEWECPFYQYANRLAHLHFLTRTNGLDAYLLFMSFADAPDVPDPASVEEWQGAHRVVWRALGLGKSSFRGRVAKVIIPVPTLLA